MPAEDILAVYTEVLNTIGMWNLLKICVLMQVVLPILEPLKDEKGELPASAKDFSKYLETTYIGHMVDGRCTLIEEMKSLLVSKAVEPSQWSHHKHLAANRQQGGGVAQVSIKILANLIWQIGPRTVGPRGLVVQGAQLSAPQKC